MDEFHRTPYARGASKSLLPHNPKTTYRWMSRPALCSCPLPLVVLAPTRTMIQHGCCGHVLANPISCVRLFLQVAVGDACAARPMNPRLRDGLRRSREWHLCAKSVVHCRLALCWDLFVHQRAVPIPLDIRPQALASAPHNLPFPRVRGIALLHCLHVSHELQGDFVAHKIHERVTEVTLSTKIHRHVHEVKQPCIARLCELLNDLRLRKVIWKITNHEGR